MKKVVRLCSEEVYRKLHGNILLSWAFHLGHKELEESFVAVFYGRGLTASRLSLQERCLLFTKLTCCVQNCQSDFYLLCFAPR